MAAGTEHVGLGCSSMTNADRFYRDLLGLEQTMIKPLSAERAEGLFGIALDMQMVHYTGPASHFEIFVYPEFEAPVPLLSHVCISVPDRDDFVADCHTAGVTVIEQIAGDRKLVFVRDFDGNLFEVV